MMLKLFKKRDAPVVQKAGSVAPVAVLGDIHANLEALEAVLADIKQSGIKQFACTGDIIGYGADPRKCLEIVRNLNCSVVQGNHDYYAATDDSLSDFTLPAMNAMLWTRAQLSGAERKWLGNLPLKADVTTEYTETTENVGANRQVAHLVHSSLLEPEKWHYVLKPEAADRNLLIQNPDVVFFGHTHVPSLFSFHLATKEFRTVFPLGEGTHSLEPGWKYLINPGSVGQPRDHDPRASYAVFDPAKRTVTLRRVKYDIASAQRKITEAGLPVRNADRLAKGR